MKFCRPMIYIDVFTIIMVVAIKVVRIPMISNIVFDIIINTKYLNNQRQMGFEKVYMKHNRA